MQSALSSILGGTGVLQSSSTVTAPVTTLPSDVTDGSPPGHAVLISSEEDDSSESEDDRESAPPAPPTECAERNFVLDVVDTPVLELNSDAALILKGIKATADTDPGLVRHIQSVPLPGRRVSSTGISDKLQLAPDPVVSSWVNYHLNWLRGWKERGAAQWSESSSFSDFNPLQEKFLRPRPLWRGPPPVQDPNFPPPIPLGHGEYDLCLPRDSHDRHKAQAVRDSRLLAVERASQATLEALSISSTFLTALSSVLLEPGDPTQLRLEPDSDLTLSLLQALPGALSHSANAAACGYIDARLARRDELLERSNFSAQACQQLRLSPISSSLFDPSQLKDARAAHTAESNKPLTGDSLVKALRAAAVPPAHRHQGGQGKQGTPKRGRKRKASSEQQQHRGQPAKRGRGGRTFTFKSKPKALN